MGGCIMRVWMLWWVCVCVTVNVSIVQVHYQGLFQC